MIFNGTSSYFAGWAHGHNTHDKDKDSTPHNSTTSPANSVGAGEHQVLAQSVDTIVPKSKETYDGMM